MTKTLERNLEDQADDTAASVGRNVEGKARKAAGGLEDAGDRLDRGIDDAADDAASTLGQVRDQAERVIRSGGEQLADAAEHGKEMLRDASHRAVEGYEDIRGRLEQAYHDGFSEGRRALRRSADNVDSFAREHPLAVCAIGIAGGILLGALLPRSRAEDRLVGPYADEIGRRVQSHGDDVVRKGRKGVERAIRRGSDA